MVSAYNVVPPGSTEVVAPLPIAIDVRLRGYDRAFSSGVTPDAPLSWVMRTSADISVDVLDEAFAFVWSRHDALRMGFSLDPPKCYVIEGREAPAVSVADCARGGPGGTDFDRWLAYQVAGPFDVSGGPLVRPFMILDAGDTYIGVTADHLIIDLMSFRIFSYELCQYYDARRLGLPCELEPPPFQYSSFLADRERQLEAGSRAEAIRYYAGTGRDMSWPAPLPLHHLVPSFSRLYARALEYTLPREVTRSVQEYARSRRTTPFVVWLACLAASQGRIALELGSEQREFGAAIPLLGRSLSGAERVIGDFTNTAYVSTVPLTSSLDAIVEDLREQVAAALQFQDVSVYAISEGLSPGALDTVPAPFVCFNYLSTRRPNKLSLGGSELRLDQRFARNVAREFVGIDVFIDFNPDETMLWVAWGEGQYEEADVSWLMDLVCSTARSLGPQAV